MQNLVKKLTDIPRYITLFALIALLACRKKSMPVATVELPQAPRNLGPIHKNTTTENFNNEGKTTNKTNIDKKSRSKQDTVAKKDSQTDILPSKLRNQKKDSSVTKKSLQNSVENIDALSTDPLKASKQVVAPKKTKIPSTKSELTEDSEGNEKKLSKLPQVDDAPLEDPILLDNYSLSSETSAESERVVEPEKSSEQKALNTNLETCNKNIDLLEKEIKNYQEELTKLKEDLSVEKAPKKLLKEIKNRLIKEDLIANIVNQSKIKKATRKGVIEIIIEELHNRCVTLGLAKKSLQSLATSKKESEKNQNELEKNINTFDITKLKYNKIKDCISLFTSPSI